MAADPKYLMCRRCLTEDGVKTVDNDSSIRLDYISTSTCIKCGEVFDSQDFHILEPEEASA